MAIELAQRVPKQSEEGRLARGIAERQLDGAEAFDQVGVEWIARRQLRQRRKGRANATVKRLELLVVESRCAGKLWHIHNVDAMVQRWHESLELLAIWIGGLIDIELALRQALA